MSSSLLVLLLLAALVAALLPHGAAAAEMPLPDENEHCAFWTSIGECGKNPNYMLRHCATSCASQKSKAAPLPSSFYDIVERDIHGNELSFSRFRGKVVYVVNVASQCGYTASNYAQIRDLQQYASRGLEIVLAPCNAFGQQEPGSPADIYQFADRQGFSGTILSKDEVNGDASRTLFRYLKHQTGKNVIQWNFDGKFLIDRSGKAYAVDSNDLENKILQLLDLPASSGGDL